MKFLIPKSLLLENINITNGVILIKGKKLDDGTQRLYITTTKNISDFNRLKTDNSSAQPAKMVKIDPKIARISVVNGKLKANYVSFSSENSLNNSLNITNYNVVLNNNKTPLWWESLEETNIGKVINKLQNQILNLNGIKWVN